MVSLLLILLWYDIQDKQLLERRVSSPNSVTEGLEPYIREEEHSDLSFWYWTNSA